MSVAEALFGVPVSILEPIDLVVDTPNDLVVDEEFNDLIVKEESGDLVANEEFNDLVVKKEFNDLIANEEFNDLVVKEEFNDLVVKEESGDLVVDEEFNDLIMKEESGDLVVDEVVIEDFQKLSLKDLKELAKILAVSISGNKSTLVTRITTSALPLGVEELPEPFTRLTSWFKK
jgi:hypothetical protein